MGIEIQEASEKIMHTGSKIGVIVSAVFIIILIIFFILSKIKNKDKKNKYEIINYRWLIGGVVLLISFVVFLGITNFDLIEQGAHNYLLYLLLILFGGSIVIANLLKLNKKNKKVRSKNGSRKH